MPDAPRADAWKLLAKIAANPAAFAASGAVASATGASICAISFCTGSCRLPS